MKRIIGLISILFLTSVFINAQGNITETFYLSASIDSYSQKHDSIKTGDKKAFKRTTYQADAQNLGALLAGNADSTSRITYRGILRISTYLVKRTVSVTSIQINYSVATASVGSTFKITQINSAPRNATEAWGAAGNSTSLKTGVTYSGNSISPGDFLKSALESAIRSGSDLILGIACEAEATTGTNTSLGTFSLTINTTRPKENITITARNNMDGYNGGIIKVNNNTVASPATNINVYEGQAVSLEAVSGQNHNNYNWIWNNSGSGKQSIWTRDNINQNSSITQTINYAIELRQSIYEAHLRKLCNVTVSANKPNLWIKVNGTQYNCPAVANAIVEGEVQLEAQEEYYDQTNELKHRFDHWSDNGSTSRSRAILINSHTQIQAVYKTYPAFPSSKRNAQQNNSTVGEAIKITWNEHPSSGVTSYEIWRRVKTGSAVKIADVNRGVGYYEDGSYSYGTYQQNFVLYYDVRPYYSPDATLAPENCNIMAYGRNIPAPKVSEKDDKAIAAIEEVIETGIDNYPNPFNPATTIRYAVAEGGKVSIKVYDITGKEVAILVDEVKEKGRYQVTFDGSKLASGPYFYRMTAPGYAITKKILLMK